MSQERLKYFDGLRGLAAIIVILHHYDLGFNIRYHLPEGFFKELLEKQPFALLYQGHIAVNVFFILSGYVLSYPYFSSPNTSYLISAATKRYFRLQLPILGSICFSYLLLKLHLTSNLTVASITGSEWMSTFWNLPNYFPSVLEDSMYTVMFIGQGYYNAPVLWTMNVEFYGSIVLFGFLAVFGSIRKKWILYLLIFFLLKGSYFQGFLFGLVVCDYFWNLEPFEHQEILALFFLLCTQILVRLPTHWISNMSHFCDVQLVYALFIVLAVKFSPKGQKILSLPFFHFLGTISFSLYLLHPLVLASLSCSLFLLGGYWGCSYTSSVLFSFVVSMCFLVPFSYLYYRWVDKTGMKVAKYIYSSIFAPVKSE